MRPYKRAGDRNHRGVLEGSRRRVTYHVHMPHMFDSDHHHRRSIRLRDYDYRQVGIYFVTLCTADRACIFGNIVDEAISLSDLGVVARDEWLRTAQVRPETALDEYIIMPNHLHALVALYDSASIPAGHAVAPHTAASHVPTRAARSLPSLVAGYKAATTRRINDLRGTPGAPVWQRNYYEHIVRRDDELDRIRRYIRNNPVQWAQDKENPATTAM